MPKPLQYNVGSLIYCQGDASDKVFVLQSGKVSLVYQDIETGEDIREQLKAGEFFGAKSALGRYQREESAIAMVDKTTVMAFSINEFEALVMSNPGFVMKMLKVFSGQMRRIHKHEVNMVSKKPIEPAEGLYNIGEYYLKNKYYSFAKYIFTRYLEYYPLGENADRVKEKLEMTKNIMEEYGGDPQALKVAKVYGDAMDLIANEKYKEAYALLKEVTATSAELAGRSSFEMGRCLFLMDSYEECLKFFSEMLENSQGHADELAAMFYMGQCHEKTGKKDIAAALYKKIISSGKSDSRDTVEKAKDALAGLGG